jgi:hypothetical protein
VDLARRGQYIVGAMRQEVFADSTAKGRRLGSRTDGTCSNRTAAVDGHDDRDKLDLVTGMGQCERPYRRLAAAAKSYDDGALSIEGRARCRVVHRFDSRLDSVIVDSHLDGHNALTRSWHADRGGQTHRNPIRKPETAQARCGKHKGVKILLVQFAQPRIQIAANRNEAGFRQQPDELCDSPHTARADGRALAKRCR